jgi:hypothetical protein
MMNRISFFAVILSGLIWVGCDSSNKNAEITSKKELPVITANVPVFNADSAYYFIQRQVEFGPRVPNTRPHIETGDFIISKLEGYGFEVQVQPFEATTFDNQNLYLRNIIGSYNKGVAKRILLAAHWDTRPYADKDDLDQDTPIDGANDGASGVGVLLEIARSISRGESKPQVGVDMIFFDGEDWGELNSGPRERPPANLDSWWCLGSQYWSKNKHEDGYSAYYGILFDMVGGKNAQFPIEGYSDKYAGKVTRKVWDWGNVLGYGDIFIYDVKPAITDDHKYVNEIGKIPMMDIVHYDNEYGYFGDFHHTQKDNLELIDKRTIEAAGNTVLHVLYHE